MTLHLSLLLLAVAGAWWGVGLTRRYALRRLIDLPNERSSHQQPTPRGGGLGLTFAHLGVMTVAMLLTIVQPDLFKAVAVGGVAVATIGFLDDHGHVDARLRLLCHALAFSWAVWWFGGLPAVDFGWGPVNLGWLGSALLMLYLAWFLNLFNFMDGIDGIAAVQAVTMTVSAALLIAANSNDWGAGFPLWLLAASSLGFLWWNWPPAKIFMGDVGSGYLGYALGVLALWTVVEGWLTPWVWLILGGTFLADATVTLAVRALSRVSVATAHRSHAYQRLSRHWRSHRRVTLSFLFVNVVWLSPLAWIATKQPAFGMVASLIALTPLFFTAVRLGAGRPGEISDSLSR